MEKNTKEYLKGLTSFEKRWLLKATKITGKSLDYICYSNETYNEAINEIRTNAKIKPNRIINKLRDYRKYMQKEQKIKECA